MWVVSETVSNDKWTYAYVLQELLSILQFYAHVYLCDPSKISLLMFIFPFYWNCKTGFSQVYNNMHSTLLKLAFKQFHSLVLLWPVQYYSVWQAIIWCCETLNPSCAAIVSRVESYCVRLYVGAPVASLYLS